MTSWKRVLSISFSIMLLVFHIDCSRIGRSFSYVFSINDLVTVVDDSWLILFLYSNHLLKIVYACRIGVFKV